jgi:hypothetical protein
MKKPSTASLGFERAWEWWLMQQLPTRQAGVYQHG